MMYQKGQALILVIIIMATAITVALSLAARSIVSLKDNVNQQESQKAYAVAESGVETVLQQLKNGDSITTPPSNDPASTINIVVSPVPQNSAQFLMNNGSKVPVDDGADLWLVKHDISGKPNIPDIATRPSSGSITIHYSDHVTSQCSAAGGTIADAGIEVIVVIFGGTNYYTNRYAWDPCSAQREAGIGNIADLSRFAGSSLIYPYDNTTYHFDYSTGTIPIKDAIFARIIPLYNSSDILVDSTSFLPQQGNLVSALGSNGNTQRRINVFASYPQLAAEYFYGLLAP